MTQTEYIESLEKENRYLKEQVELLKKINELTQNQNNFIQYPPITIDHLTPSEDWSKQIIYDYKTTPTPFTYVSTKTTDDSNCETK